MSWFPSYGAHLIETLDVCWYNVYLVCTHFKGHWKQFDIPHCYLDAIPGFSYTYLFANLLIFQAAFWPPIGGVFWCILGTLPLASMLDSWCYHPRTTGVIGQVTMTWATALDLLAWWLRRPIPAPPRQVLGMSRHKDREIIITSPFIFIHILVLYTTVMIRNDKTMSTQLGIVLFVLFFYCHYNNNDNDDNDYNTDDRDDDDDDSDSVHDNCNGDNEYHY